MAQDDRLQVRVLGPIRVLDQDGRDLTPEGVLQRRLLAMLVLRRDRVLPVDAAVEVLWPVQAPRDPVAALHNQVFRLRRRLPGGLVESVGDGYRLPSSRIELDVDRLTSILNRDVAGPELLTPLDGVLESWHGPAYPELEDTDAGRVEAARLGELKMRAREIRAECRLATGELEGVIPELATLIDAEPLRERPRALLMAALARSGRHAEALRVYDDFRRLLASEVGIEPSPSLTAQHADLLTGTDLGTWTTGTWLPIPVTSLIGRESLVPELTAAVGAHRVVTLVGPGGVGKTRLAVEVGHRLRSERSNRPVVMCELATADSDAAIDVVAAALRVEARSGTSTVERVVGALGDTELVVILDNCEHVLEPVAELVERVLAACPHVAVLATSRERLRVDGERVYTVPTLDADDTDGPAVCLFLDRARAVAPSFDPDEVALAHVGEIVRRLDGLPLAIELAAARLHTYDIVEVASGLDHRFSLLSSGSRTSTRHSSLSAAVSWSYSLLDERLRRTFAALSVFAGAFTATDAAAICDTEPAVIGEALTQLTEQSLVTRAAGRRYLLLETLRAFGAEQLAATGRTDEIAARHARYAVGWIERAQRELLAGPTTIADIDAAVPDLRSALAWLLDQGEIEPAGRLVAALVHYGFLRQRPDVLAWAERVTAADPEDRSPLAAQAWVTAAYAAWLGGDASGTSERATRALRISEATTGAVPAEVAAACGNVDLFAGRLDEAARWFHQSAETAVDDPGQRLVSLGAETLARAYASDPSVAEIIDAFLDEIGDATNPYAAYLWYCGGEAVLRTDTELARARLSHAIELAEQTGASFVTGLAGASRASIDARCGDPLAAAADYRRLIGLWRRAGVWSTQWTMLRSVAVLLERLERPRDAAVLEGAVRATTAGHRIFGADEAALAELGQRLRASLGDEEYESARREGAVLDGDAAVEHALRCL